MMTKAEYLSIRGERDFLYRYFLKCGGMQTSSQMFNNALARWLQAFGLNPYQGMDIIIVFLDKKFAR